MPDGQTIYDQHVLDAWRLTFKGGTVHREPVNAAAFLTQADQQQLAAYAEGGALPELTLGVFGGGRALLVVGRGLFKVFGVFVVDLRTGKLVSPFIPLEGNVTGFLSADGSRIVFEGFERGKGKSSDTRTGQFWVREADSGKLLKEFKAAELAGALNEVRLLCEAPTGARVYGRAKGRKLSWFDPDLDVPVRELPVHLVVDASLGCIVADR